MKRVKRFAFIAMLLTLMVNLSGCFPVFVPGGHRHGHGYGPYPRHGYYGGGYRDYGRGWGYGGYRGGYGHHHHH